LDPVLVIALLCTCCAGLQAAHPLAQPLLRFTPEALNCAKIASLAWAMLYLLVTVDPALQDKVEAVRSLATARDVGRPPPGN
jgi:hypothetical protein